jgi:hypothetical protein
MFSLIIFLFSVVGPFFVSASDPDPWNLFWLAYLLPYPHSQFVPGSRSSLDVLIEGLGEVNLNFRSKKYNFFQLYIFFIIFGIIKTLDLDLYLDPH